VTGAVGMRLRAELRERWRSWLGLALLVGVGGGVVLALAAGARRTDSAYSRFVSAQNAWDVVVFNFPDEGGAAFDYDELVALPEVVDSSRGDAEYLSLGGGQLALASTDGRLGTEINQQRILEGRVADPDAPEEAIVPFTVAEDLDLEVGDRLEMYFSADELEATIPPGREPTPGEQMFLDNLRAIEEALPDGHFEIVGIEASPNEFPPRFAGAAIPVHLTPAFARINQQPSGEFLAVLLEHGQADIPAFRKELEQRSGGRFVDTVVQSELSQNTERSIHLQAVSLWILAGLTAIVAALILGQMLARQARAESTFGDVLSALGMSHRQRYTIALGRAALVGIGGAIVATVLAVAVAPLFPTGLARIAEPDRGLAFDALVLLLGGLIVALVVVSLAAWPAWRATRTVGGESRERAERSSRVAQGLARAGASAPTTIGVRMALEPGRAREPVPVWSTLAVVALGVSVLIGTTVFAASLGYLLDTPQLYGSSWDLAVTNYGTGAPLDRDGVAVAEQTDGVDGIAVGEAGVNLEINGERVDGIALTPVEGDVVPPLLDGRAPQNKHEIVLGERTRDAFGVNVGDRVDVTVSGSTADRRLEVVGIGVIPTTSPTASLGEGAFLTQDGLREFIEPPGDGYRLLLSLEPGIDADTALADLEAGLAQRCIDHPNRCLDGNAPLARVTNGEPTDIVNFGRVRNMPLLLGAALAILAGGTLALVLGTAVRRRRRELALLKALGFDRRQCTATVAWQANATIAVGLLIGVPLGVIVGRGVWSYFADELGILSRPQVPLLTVMWCVVGAIALANVIAIIPARAAARAAPATVLRSE
jgi:ABC-type lipoprotein release transport system permease subunit